MASLDQPFEDLIKPVLWIQALFPDFGPLAGTDKTLLQTELNPLRFVVQPDGKIVIAAVQRIFPRRGTLILIRLLPNGS